MTIYKWKPGAHVRGPAQVAGEECARLEAEGRLTPRELVDESRPDDAPLHHCFEWNDGIAAERWREAQAGQIIRCVEVVREDMSQPVRAFTPVIVTPDEARVYRSVETVMATAGGRKAVLDEAKRELAAFRRKYAGLKELAEVMQVVNTLLSA